MTDPSLARHSSPALPDWHSRPAPQPVLAQRDSRPTPWPLLRANSARALEAFTASQLPPHTLMQRAGLGVARLAQAVAPHARRIAVVCGPGNNGGDGIEAALHLLRHGAAGQMALQVHLLGDAARLPTDATASLARAHAAGMTITQGLPGPLNLDAQDLLIDALLGRGLARPATGLMSEAIAHINACVAPVLAVDLPSGLPGDSGALTADAPCVQARWTLALLSLSPGLFTAQGRDVGGDIWFDDVGVVPNGPADAWLASGPSLTTPWQARQHHQHKGSFGDLWVVGGATSMAGAANLAARAALAAGAGRVYLCTLDATSMGACDGLNPELMRADCNTLLASPDRLTRGTVVAGCGGGTAIAAALPGLLAHSGRLMLDADGLNAVAADTALRTALQQRAAKGLVTVLTPHPLEAARLLGTQAAQVQADRLHSAARLAQDLQAIVVLKGSGTVVARPDAAPWVHPVGNAALATPGSGDVLAGWLGGLWSAAPSTMVGNAMDAAWQAARLAVWQHGRTAETIHPSGRPLPASELVAALGAA